ncbi:hypothetical protein OG714_54110 [Streptomyces sp. NBC_00989]|nr:hypothetical protein OG714_00030 [Streptomyces sp. NBC_00989]WSW98161.1 hypothetical protein OG714_54110 [Streptomyces sp. NBC_00989]
MTAAHARAAVTLGVTVHGPRVWGWHGRTLGHRAEHPEHGVCWLRLVSVAAAKEGGKLWEGTERAVAAFPAVRKPGFYGLHDWTAGAHAYRAELTEYIDEPVLSPDPVLRHELTLPTPGSPPPARTWRRSPPPPPTAPPYGRSTSTAPFPSSPDYRRRGSTSGSARTATSMPPTSPPAARSSTGRDGESRPAATTPPSSTPTLSSPPTPPPASAANSPPSSKAPPAAPPCSSSAPSCSSPPPAATTRT